MLADRAGMLAGCVALLSGAASTFVRARLDLYCVTCHSDRLRTGGVALEGLDLADAAGNAEFWEAVVRKLRVGAMPPQSRPLPDQPDCGGLRAWLETELGRAAVANPNPGRTGAWHRLRRTWYHNVIRDLLDLDVDVTDLLAAKAADMEEMMRLLADLGANPDLTTDNGATPTMSAGGGAIWRIGENPVTNEEALAAVTLTWALRNDVNTTDASGDTALHGAVHKTADGPRPVGARGQDGRRAPAPSGPFHRDAGIRPPRHPAPPSLLVG